MITTIAAAALVPLLSAQAAGVDVPVSVDPAKIEERFKREQRPAASTTTEALPVLHEAALPEALRRQMAATRFVLKDVEIKYATVYAPEELRFAYEDMLDKEISLLDTQTIIRRITDRYRNDTYILSQAFIPPQVLTDGTLVVHVIEGFISEVRFDGDIADGEQRLLDQYAEQIAKHRPISMNDLERYLLLMNDLPGVNARGLIRPSSVRFGAAELVVAVEETPYEGYVSVDNRGSKFVGPFQHTVSGTANSLFGWFDRTTVRTVTTSPTDELRFIDVQHVVPFGGDGARATFTASRSHTEPGDALKSVAIRGVSTFLQARASYPFLRSRRENFRGRIIFDMRDTDTDIFTNTNLSTDRLRVARASGSYDFVDGLDGINAIDMQVSQGVNLFNASDSGPLRSRTDGESRFTKISTDVSRTQELPMHMTLVTTATGQYSPHRLLAAEQFSLGGANFGSAYDPSELSGDYGAAAKAELRYGEYMNMEYLEWYQFYGFYDIGRVWINDGGPGANDKMSLSSTGIGLRTSFMPSLSSSVEAALPLTKPVASQAGHADQARVFFNVTGRF